MDKYSFNAKSHKVLSFLEKLLQEGEQWGLNYKEVRDKINHLRTVIESNQIKIALIGRFSDGKTSILAGMLGQKKENMNIGLDETSDQLYEYSFDDNNNEIVFIDTPGLFGTKEREIEGKNIKISEITEKFLSEAHIILYVCNAVTPIKECQECLIFDILKKYNKLPVTIFILNKMDNVCLLEDETDFNESAQIKSYWLITKLKDKLSISDDEAKNIKCVCVAADPDSKGLDYWFEQTNYLDLSRISSLRITVDELVKTCDKNLLKSANIYSVTQDVLNRINQISEKSLVPLETSLVKEEDVLLDIRNNFESVKISLREKRKELRDTLDTERMRILSLLNNATLDNFQDIIDKEFGSQDSNGNFGIFISNIDGLFSDSLGGCSELDIACQNSIIELNKKTNEVEGLLRKYGKNIDKLKVNNKNILFARDFVKSNYKFKPWGAVKLANKINVGIAVLGLAIEAYKTWRKYKEEKKLQEKTIPALKQYVDKVFVQCLSLVNDDNKFYTLVPSFLVLQELIHSKDQMLNVYKTEIEQLRAYQEKVENYLTLNAEDVEFEDL